MSFEIIIVYDLYFNNNINLKLFIRFKFIFDVYIVRYMYKDLI